MGLLIVLCCLYYVVHIKVKLFVQCYSEISNIIMNFKTSAIQHVGAVNEISFLAYCYSTAINDLNFLEVYHDRRYFLSCNLIQMLYIAVIRNANLPAFYAPICSSLVNSMCLSITKIILLQLLIQGKTKHT